MVPKDDEIYVLNGAAPGEPNRVQIYDTAADSWSDGKECPERVEAAAAVALGRKVYFFGGAQDHDATGAVAVKSTVYIYDTFCKTWSSGPDMPTARSWATAAYLNGAFHVLGGFDGSQTAVNAHEVWPVEP